jgi:hypothetical protein
VVPFWLAVASSSSRSIVPCPQHSLLSHGQHQHVQLRSCCSLPLRKRAASLLNRLGGAAKRMHIHNSLVHRLRMDHARHTQLLEAISKAMIMFVGRL